MRGRLTWTIWIFRIFWLGWLAFCAEAALGSWKELERRAFIISLIIFVISLLVGLGLWLRSWSKGGLNHPRGD